MTQQLYHIYVQENRKQDLDELSAHPHLEECYSQEPRGRANPNVPPWMEEWVHKMWRRHTMEHYSALEKEGDPVAHTTRTDLGNTVT